MSLSFAARVPGARLRGLAAAEDGTANSTFSSVRRIASGPWGVALGGAHDTQPISCPVGKKDPQIIEVTPAKQVVWTFKDFETFGDSVAVVLDP